MTFGKTAASLALLAMAVPAAAQAPLPGLRIEPTDGGSIFYIRNPSTQPLTAYLIELVNYPGSSFALWQDDAAVAAETIAPGGERRTPISNMTVGAVPDYVKMQAAIYADGTTAGIAEKVTQLVERRRAVLETTRELIQRLEKGQTGADLKQWSDGMPAIPRAQRNSQAAINQSAAQLLIAGTIARMNSGSTESVLSALRNRERVLAASKPAL
jgi:hypothetical protein